MVGFLLACLETSKSWSPKLRETLVPDVDQVKWSLISVVLLFARGIPFKIANQGSGLGVKSSSMESNLGHTKNMGLF